MSPTRRNMEHSSASPLQKSKFLASEAYIPHRNEMYSSRSGASPMTAPFGTATTSGEKESRDQFQQKTKRRRGKLNIATNVGTSSQEERIRINHTINPATLVLLSVRRRLLCLRSSDALRIHTAHPASTLADSPHALLVHNNILLDMLAHLPSKQAITHILFCRLILRKNVHLLLFHQPVITPHFQHTIRNLLDFEHRGPLFNAWH